MIRAALAVLVLAGAGACEDRVPSPTGVLFAQYTKCRGQNPCTPEVVITNQNGAEVRRFAIRTDQGPCGSIVKVQWVGENIIGSECHGNPSLSYYYEVDATTGKVLREYLGYGFVRSPDLAKVAKGFVYGGVHEFKGRFAWSPDSRRVGFIDCLVDYRLRDGSPEAFEEGGKRENERCFLLAVRLDGTFAGAPISVVSSSAPGQEVGLTWTDARTLVARFAARNVQLRVR
jgi:hypothetical protein